MKKTRLFMVILALLMLCTMLALTSCGDEDSGVVVDPNATSVPLQTSAYFFKSGDAKITLFMTMSDLKSALGEPNATYENPSCGYVGMDVFYQYSGFELTINEIDGTQVVTDIFIVDDTVSIPEGLKIGDSEEKISQLIGEKYTKDGSAYNFVDGNTLLQILVEDGAVKSIEYKPAN